MINRKIAVKCGHMLEPSGNFISQRVILIEGGTIQNVENRIDIPHDYKVIDASDSWVTPGLIESHGHLNVDNPSEVSCDPINPDMSSIDDIDPFDPVIQDIRNAGITTMCVLPGSARLINGTGIAVKMKNAIASEEMILKECQPLKIALGENPIMISNQKNCSPNSRLGNTALLKKAFYNVADKLEKDAFESEKQLSRQEKILAEALEGKRIVKIHCHSEQDIATAVRIAEEFQFHYTLEHATAGYRMAEYLSKKNVRCCIGPVFMPPLKTELKDISPYGPAVLSKMGVHFSLIQDSCWETIYLPSLAGICVAYGLSSEKALQALTTEAAENIGLSHRIGSIEKGKDADLAVFDGNPLLNTTLCRWTMIDGTIYTV